MREHGVRCPTLCLVSLADTLNMTAVDGKQEHYCYLDAGCIVFRYDGALRRALCVCVQAMLLQVHRSYLDAGSPSGCDSEASR